MYVYYLDTSCLLYQLLIKVAAILTKSQPAYLTLHIYDQKSAVVPVFSIAKGTA